MEIVRFIFSSFCTFIGTFILLALIFQGIAGIIWTIRKPTNGNNSGESSEEN